MVQGGGVTVTPRSALEAVDLGDRFTDVRLLRAGSRFTIYEAREPAANRSVVIKVPDLSSASWLHDVLDHEAEALAPISSHPHIVTLYQRFSVPDGRPALLLERCTASLADTLRDGGRFSLRDTLTTGIKLAGALETVHQSGVVHCDVRPRNILVSEWGEPVLSGFDECVRLDARLNTPPLHVTTAHTAPELLEGAEATAHSDVYGLASTLYELVAGRAAFRAYAGESAAATVARVLGGRVKPIVADGVPLAMSDLLTWAMNPDPARRPPSPAWMAEELGRIEADQDFPRTRMIG